MLLVEVGQSSRMAELSLQLDQNRAALVQAQARLEFLQSNPRVGEPFAMDSLHVRPFVHAGQTLGTESWMVTWFATP